MHAHRHLSDTQARQGFTERAGNPLQLSDGCGWCDDHRLPHAGTGGSPVVLAALGDARWYRHDGLLRRWRHIASGPGGSTAFDAEERVRLLRRTRPGPCLTSYVSPFFQGNRGARVALDIPHAGNVTGVWNVCFMENPEIL